MQLIKRVTKFILKVWAATTIGTIVFFVMTIGSLVAIGALAAVASGSKLEEQKVVYGEELAEHKFVSIPINGVIMGDRSSTSDWLELLSESGVVYGYEVKDQLRKLAEDDDVAGVILEINSPGGTIFGSQAIADGVEYYRQKTKKPVVAFVSNMAASGGYWSAVSADYIVADAGTMVGSIGVIFGPIKYYDGVLSEDGGAFVGGVQTTGGIETEYITAGNSKDLGNPYRRLTTEERAHLQKMVDGSYEQFVGYVADRRNLEPSQIKQSVGALVYDELQAKEIGLIDWRGSKESAYDLLASKAEVAPDDYKIIRELSPNDVLGNLFAKLGFVSGRTVSSPLCSLQSSVLAFYGTTTVQCGQ
ncbi:MAG: signal peptide peptidase SppA [Candidatus Pacebacteria bacterium]|nr:signal peptide peptidase SppA [Candidatus Paceibacterota bacterium]